MSFCYDIGYNCGPLSNLCHVVYATKGITNGTQASVVYLSLKQGAGAKTGTDGRMFYLWYDKDLRKLFKGLGFQVMDSSKSASLVNSKDIWLGYVLEKP